LNLHQPTKKKIKKIVIIIIPNFLPFLAKKKHFAKDTMILKKGQFKKENKPHAFHWPAILIASSGGI